MARLREAIKLSDKPNDLRLRLARKFLEAGRMDEARQTYDAVFEAETDPKLRLSLTRQLAEVYMQQGKLDDLIARFRQRQRAEEGGWRYALYLAEIFQQMQDFTAAREELSKALGARSRDGNFLRKLMELSEAEGNTVERARFARLLAEAEPGEAHQIDLAEALLDNGETEEALKILRANEEALLKDPIPWREVLLKFHHAGAGDAVAGTLRAALEKRATDWRGRHTHAEMQHSMEDMSGAEKWLWEILSMTPEAVAGAAPEHPAICRRLSWRSPPVRILSQLDRSILGSVPYQEHRGTISAPTGVTSFGSNWRKSLRKQGAPAAAAAIITAGDMPPATAARSTQPAISSLEEAKDTALLYLAMIAEQQNRGESFIADLDKHLAGASRAERIIVFSLVQAADLLKHEIELEAAHPSGDSDLDAFCLQSLVGFVEVEARQQSQSDAELALIEKFVNREHQPVESLEARQTYYNLLTQAGRVDEAGRIAERCLAEADTAGMDTLPLIFGVALEREAFDVAEKILPRLLAASQQPGGSVLKQQMTWYRFSLASALLQRKDSVPRGVRLLADTLEESYPKQLPAALSAMPFYARQSYRAAWFEGQQFPYANRYFDDARIQMWQQIFQRLKAADALDAMKEELNRHIQSLPGDQTVYAQLARACFWWWDGARSDAIREVVQLAHELKDDDLRIMVSVMLVNNGQPAEALGALDEVTATTGDAGIDKQVRMLTLARAANDLDRAKTIALKLAEQRLNANDEAQVMNVLRELGLNDKAQELMKRRTAVRTPGMPNGIEQQLEQQVQAKNETGALALARAILARDPLTTMPMNGDYARQRAIDAMRTFKALSAYRAELTKQLADAPSSVRTIYLLAEATAQDEPRAAIDYYRKLVELKPTDTHFQLRLATMLANNKNPEEALRIWEALLARDPDAVMQEAFSEMYQACVNTKQMSRLGAALTKLPKRSNSAAMAMLGGGMVYTNFFTQVASQLQQEGKTKEAIDVWRAAIEYEPQYGNDPNLIAPLASALVETGDNAAAASTLDRYFFPEERRSPFFGFENGVQGVNWSQTISYGGGAPEAPAVGLLKLAQQAGSLDGLRAKAQAAATPENELSEELVLLIDSVRRNAAGLDDFSSRLRARH